MPPRTTVATARQIFYTTSCARIPYWDGSLSSCSAFILGLDRTAVGWPVVGPMIHQQFDAYTTELNVDD
eukprot:scaffold174599_cov35-Prasinocladus_malaysianus.AAC.1